ncbi:hypothetical protein LOZ66_002442, partial [Ophidiomyces ophidiicola]
SIQWDDAANFQGILGPLGLLLFPSNADIVRGSYIEQETRGENPYFSRPLRRVMQQHDRDKSVLVSRAATVESSYIRPWSPGVPTSLGCCATPHKSSTPEDLWNYFVTISTCNYPAGIDYVADAMRICLER